MDITEFKKNHPDLVNRRPWVIFLTYGKCAHCDLKLELIEQNTKHFNAYGIKNGEKILFTIDHIVPKSKDGKDALSNLQALCKPCNENKGDDSETEYYRPDGLPADYAWQMSRRTQDRKSKDFYPDWKPYYGL